jgi:hypothetical protein
MSKMTEYLTVHVTWEYFIQPCFSEETLKQTFDLNMQALEDHVNEYLEMGWQPLGPPTFSSNWLSRTRHGIAIQALTRERDVEQAEVADVALPAVAEQVKLLRSSPRLSGQNRN